MSRDAILAAVRTACAATRADAARDAALTARLANPPRHRLPVHRQQTAAELERHFNSRLAAQGADIIAMPDARRIPDAIATYLRDRNLPLAVRAGSDPYVAALPWQDAPDLALLHGAAQPFDTAGLSVAAAGVAETGTLVLASGPDNPVTLAFLPEVHLVVLRAETIVASYEEACDRLAGALPRTLNLVSGPSRTGDIGGKLVMGAHGPRRLAVFLITH